MNNMTFLEENQIFGNNQLKILKKYGTKCAITDFSILLGGYVSGDYYTNEGNSRKNRTGWWWTKTPFDNDVIIVNKYGGRDYYFVERRLVGARPALPYSSISSISSKGVRERKGNLEVEYGEYPQTIVSKELSNILERLYLKEIINKTGKIYTTSSAKYVDNYFTTTTHTEYEYNGRKYVRILGNLNCKGEVLSDGRTIQNNIPYWVEVETIKWMIDEKNNIALSKKILFSGIPFNTKPYDGNFENTTIKTFMDDYFSKEIVKGTIYESNNINQQETKIKRRKNPYNFSFDRVTEEDIIKGAVESNISVFLHGRSSEGKSARVKQLDPDCEIIYLRNATPDSLNGKSVYNSVTGEMIDVPPTWYKKIKQKCEEEPDKIHIIFFDEITNALPSIQGMAFNIILDKEVNGIWKLPENSRIIAAGNDLKDSLAANTMAEPLFNRFAHVYINTTVDSWLKWASTPNENYQRLDYEKEKSTSKIHPAIYSYIAMNGEKVLRTEYNGERPNANPRKWEMASTVLYQTNKPEMLRALIGENITADFVKFCKQEVITIEDVINGNYTEEEIRYMSSSEKYATALSLSQVNEKNFKVVREFMKKIGEEARATFDSMWVNGNEERLEIIAELDLEDLYKDLYKNVLNNNDVSSNQQFDTESSINKDEYSSKNNISREQGKYKVKAQNKYYKELKK